MKALVQSTYGSADVLRLEDRPIPQPHDDEVVVRVHAASVNAGDWRLMRADPFLVRLMVGGLLRPNHETLGSDIAGRVAAVGSAVERFRPGDAVFGDLAEVGFGGFAEFVCVPEHALAPKPDNVTFDEAAALPVAGLAALQGLRDEGGVQSGMRVLVNGASGGVGTFAVQLAQAYGARVTGVCSPGKMDLVRSLGAERVVDYTHEDVTRGEHSYDLILDTAAHRSPLRALRILNPRGTYVMVGGPVTRLMQTMLLRPFVKLFSGKRLTTLLSHPNPEDLRTMKTLAEAGQVTPVIDRRYPLSEAPDAIRYVEAGRATGKVVITVVPTETTDEPDATEQTEQTEAPLPHGSR